MASRCAPAAACIAARASPRRRLLRDHRQSRGTRHGGSAAADRCCCRRAVAEVARLPADARWIDRGIVRLRDLSHPEMIFELAHADLTGMHAPLRSLDAAPNNLPSQLTSFLGREEELRQLHTLLREARLVTVTGPGGIGKTRLALHAAASSCIAMSTACGSWICRPSPMPRASRWRWPRCLGCATSTSIPPGRSASILRRARRSSCSIPASTSWPHARRSSRSSWASRRD